MSDISFYAIVTIIKYRIKDFFKEYHYSILAPLINTLLFVIIFKTIDNYYSLTMDGKSFIDFLIPGLILMVVVQESYDHTSVTLINMKQIGSFDDFLMAPISRIEIFFALILSSIIIGFIISVINLFFLSFFVNFQNIDFKYFFYFLLLAIIFFSSLGSIIGFVAFSWDTQSSVSSFFVTPINFLSGTFFSINVLPESLKFLFIYNPYYYIVNNFRNSFDLNYYFKFQENIIIIFFVLISIILSSYVFHAGFRVIK